MERRKSKIFSHFDEIEEEKNAVVENIQKMIIQLQGYVQHVRAAKDIKQKNLQAILSYELSILKKISDINLDLESFTEDNHCLFSLPNETSYEQRCSLTTENNNKINLVGNIESSYVNTENITLPCKFEDEFLEQNPLVTLSCKEPVYETPDHLSSSEMSDIPVSCKVENVQRLQLDTCINSPLQELILSRPEHALDDSKENIDIAALKNSLQKFNEKFALTESTFISMEDFYSKPTSLPSPISKVDEPLQIQTISAPDDEPVDVVNINKDDKIENIEASDVINVVVEGKIINQSDDNKVKTIYTVESEGSSTFDTFSNISSENKDYSQTKSDSSDDANEADENQVNLPDLGVQGSELKCSALEKLNNANFLNRHEEVQKELKPLVLPDLSLKTGTVPKIIKNNFDCQSKKKNKSVHYDLKEKPVPVVGMECAFSHIESPSLFYIHLVDADCEMVDKMSEKISSYYKGSSSDFIMKSQAYNILKKYCVAFVPDLEGWYRVEVVDWLLGEKNEQVLVQLVDFGSKLQVSFKYLRKLNKELAKFPKLAMKCHFPLLYPPGSTHINRLTEWPSDTVTQLVYLAGLNETDRDDNKLFEIEYIEKIGDSLAIDLISKEEVQEDITVGYILTELGLAVELIDEVDPDNLELERFIEDAGNYGIADNINEAMTGYDAKDEVRLCSFTRSDGTCYKGKHCKLEHKKLPPGGYTTDKTLVFTSCFNNLLIPANQEVIDILITAFISSCSFFVQIIRKPHQQASHTMDKDMFDLICTMNDPRNLRTLSSYKTWPGNGEVVVARHWSNKWLRAVVRHLVFNKHGEPVSIQVYMVDFGETTDVPLSDVKQIREDFLHLPFQAVEVYLFNYTQRPDVDIKLARDFFQEHICFRNFKAVVLRSSGPPLKLWISTVKGSDIGKTLAKHNFAMKRKSDISAADGQLLQIH